MRKEEVMNPRILTLSLLLNVPLAFSGVLRAEPSAVSIRVEQDVRSEMGKVVPYTRAQSRGLVVYVSNNSHDTLDLKVKYIFFGRDAVDHKVVTLGQGEVPVTVKPSATEKADVPKVSTTAVEAHFDAKAKKKVDASGASLLGEGVQVLQGDKVVAEDYNPLSLKEEWGKAAPATAAAAAGAKPAGK
jgi:hypothetical protein